MDSSQWDSIRDLFHAALDRPEAERFAWLAGERARPEAILAITFTEKAAREIKTRLVRHFEGRPEMRTRIERALVSTIHGFEPLTSLENST